MHQEKKTNDISPTLANNVKIAYNLATVVAEGKKTNS
jgi:hypothetical protein